ncbi:hypothetical protein ACWGHM_42305 [Streptomyces sp. NPDC054904]
MPFEDELGEALRRAGDGFTADRRALVDGGELRGRRLVARRRAAMIGGSTLALALVGTAGAWTMGLDGPAGGAVHVAASPGLPIGQPGGPALNDLPPARQESRPGTSKAGSEAKAGLETLVRLHGVPTADSGGEGSDAFVVLDDGRGASRIELRIQRYASNDPSAGADFQSGTTEPNGVRAKVTQGPADGRTGVVAWRVDTLRANGVRITVTGYNAWERSGPVTRTAPVLTVAQLKEIALSPNWKDARGR